MTIYPAPPIDDEHLLAVLKPTHLLYKGAGEWAERARTLHKVFFALEEIARMAYGLRKCDPLREQARRGQSEVLIHLHAIDAMLEDPSLRWFMKSGFLDN
jgi:hypothetical protein